MLAGAVPAWPAQAQTEACAAPCVRLVPVAELSTAAAPIVPSLHQTVLRTADGRLLVSHQYANPPQVVVHEETGRVLRIYDEVGSGPGELGLAPVLLAGTEDEIWAIDRNRLLRFDQGLRHVATRNLGAQFAVSSLIPLSDSSLVLTAAPGAGERFTVRLLAQSAEWGTGRIVERPADLFGTPAVARAAAGGFWTLARDGMLLRRYDERGVAVDSIGIATQHFDAPGPRPAPSAERSQRPPRWMHIGLYDAGDDRVVVSTLVEDDGWTPIRRDETVDLRQLDRSAQYDTVLDLVDTATGSTLGSVRVEDYLQYVAGAGYLFSTHADADGHVITTVYRIEVR